jgi:DNA-binding transcriptional MocR family regulator
VTERNEVHAQWAEAGLVLYPESPVPLYVQLAAAIRRRVARWELQEGALLPSELTFAEMHSLSRETVNRAYRLLREAGVIKAKRGVGWFLVRPLPTTYVPVPPGSKVYMRNVLPGDVQGSPQPPPVLLATALIVEEPGKPPVAYDPMATVAVAQPATPSS